jgi:quercetin dioxygenase-like cupin family protein
MTSKRSTDRFRRTHGQSPSVLKVGAVKSAAYSVVDVADLEGEGPGGAVKKTRRALGARAFGFNYFTLPPGVRGREHDHAEQGQEEVIFVVKGSGTLTVDGEEVELKPGRFVRLDPEAVRVPTAGDEGLEFVTFGAPLDGRYEPPSWG